MRPRYRTGSRFTCPLATCATSLALAGLMLAGCAPASSRAPGTGSVSEASSTPKVVGGPESATSTVPAPALPRFPNSSWFVVDPDGTGKAVARFEASAPGPERRRWHRVVKLTVDGTKVDGIWVDNLTFEGRLSDDTIITAKYETAPGSGTFRRVSRRVEDILAADRSWRGFEDDTRVSVTFTKAGNGPVSIQAMTALDAIPQWVMLPDSGPQYRYGEAPDPVVANALSKLDGVSASIVGYVVDFVSNESSQGRSILEIVVGKDGKAYRMVGWGRPRAAFGHTPPARVQPESADEEAQRRRAVAAGTRLAESVIPGARAEVFAYIVRVHRIDGTVMDVAVESDGRPSWEPHQVKLQPWKEPKGPLPQALPER